eukprot:349688-Chlamydomonas_euryale.AAC.7
MPSCPLPPHSPGAPASPLLRDDERLRRPAALSRSAMSNTAESGRLAVPDGAKLHMHGRRVRGHREWGGAWRRVGRLQDAENPGAACKAGASTHSMQPWRPLGLQASMHACKRASKHANMQRGRQVLALPGVPLTSHVSPPWRHARARSKF